MTNEGIRNIEQQRVNLQDVKFINGDFREIDIKDGVIYADPPYRGTTKYETELFPYDEFYKWCVDMSKDNIVLISEYNMPSDFECIWQKEHKTSLGTGINVNSDKIRVEKLFIHKSRYLDIKCIIEI